MPALSDTMQSGRLTKWLKAPGDAVKSGEAIAEVETDKTAMDVEAFHDGYLAGPLAAIDHDYPVGATIAYIAESPAEARVSTPPAQPPQPRTEPQKASAQSTPRPQAAATAVVSHVLAAAEAHRPIVPSSRQAQAATVRAALDAGPPYHIERNSSLRESVAQNMIMAAATPSFRVTALLPPGALIDFAKQKNLALTVLLARACGHAIAAHPLFNAVYTPDGLAHREHIDIGVAVDTPGGLITPVLRNVAARSLAELSQDWHRLREKVKARRLAPEDYRGATFYLSDLGVFPVVYAFDSLIPAGASAILSVAANRPDGAFCTLACDHRVVFGGDAARFLQTLSEWLAKPAQLFEDATN